MQIQSTPLQNQRLLLIGIFACLMGIISDIFLLYSPEGGYFAQDYLFFLHRSQASLHFSHFVGVPFLPFQICGFFVIYQLLKQQIPRAAQVLFFFAAWTMIMGTVYHASLGNIATFVHLQQTNPLPQAVYEATLLNLRLYSEPFAAILFIGFLGLSAAIAVGFSHLKNAPKILIWVNPLTIYALCMSTYFWLPSVGNVLAVVVFNLAIGLYFGLILWHFFLKKEHSNL